jgi:chromosome segregation ATPase
MNYLIEALAAAGIALVVACIAAIAAWIRNQAKINSLNVQERANFEALRNAQLERLKQAAERLPQLEADVAGLRAQLATLTSENKHKADLIVSEEKEIDKLNAAIALLRAELTQVVEERDRLSSQLKDATHRLEKAARELELANAKMEGIQFILNAIPNLISFLEKQKETEHVPQTLN